MSHRRFDLVYFLGFLLVVGLSYLLANRGSEETEVVTLPDFSPPRIDFEMPFDLPYQFVSFGRPEAPKLVLSESLESVMIEVRSALLESSVVVPVKQDPQLASVLENVRGRSDR